MTENLSRVGCEGWDNLILLFSDGEIKFSRSTQMSQNGPDVV